MATRPHVVLCGGALEKNVIEDFLEEVLANNLDTSPNVILVSEESMTSVRVAMAMFSHYL
jgi:hypothetical protein